GNATQNAASAFMVNGTLSGSDTLVAGASLSGTGSVGATTLNGTDDISSAATLTVASLAVNGSGNTISSGTVNATAGTSLSNGSSLAVNGTLGGGAVTTGSGSTLSGTGTITSALTVSAGGVTSPGVGNKTGVMTTDLSYDGGSMANFNVSGTGGAGPQALNSSLFYSQMIVTGGSNTVNLGIGTGVSLQSQTAGQIQTSGSIGSSNSGVTLQLTLSSTDYNTLVSNASSDYNAKNTNNTLDNYFVFNLGTGLTAGRFETLALDVDGTTTTGLIYYAGTNDRFAADGVDNTIGDVYVTVNGVKQEFALSYTGEFADGANATIGGNDIVLTAIPEPGTWGMILGGFGMLIGFQRLRKRRMGI
ncbi:MAG: PEP-CTERM sorting domain-containing protein, partial [Chthoniobacteraceae bacterium]